MKKHLRKMLNVASLLSLIILSSCEKDLYDEAIVQEKKEILMKRVSLKELDSKTNVELFKAASRVKNKVENLAGRMVYDSIYDFYFDDEKGIYLNKDGTESYTFPIYRKNSDDKIENIIFTEKDNGMFDILLSKYDLKREDLEGLTLEQLNNTLIEYTALFDGERSLAPQLICHEELTYSQNYNTGYGGVSTQAPTTSYSWVTTSSFCYWVGGSGGGGGGGFEESTISANVPGGQTNSSTSGSGGVTTALNSGYTLAQYNFVNTLSTTTYISVQDNFVTIDSGAQNIILNYIEANKTNTALINTVQYFIRNTNLPWLGLQQASVQTSIMNYIVQNNFSSKSREIANELIDLGIQELNQNDLNSLVNLTILLEDSGDNLFTEQFAQQLMPFIDIQNGTLPNDYPLFHLTFNTYFRYKKLRQLNPEWSKTKCLWHATKEIVHISLDTFGLVPVIGEVADLSNGALYLIEGDNLNASLSVAGAVPIAGWAATGAKYAVKVQDYTNTAYSISTKVKLVWKVTGDVVSFGSRDKLRKVLGLLPGNPLQAHHLIPWSSQTKMVIQKAAQFGSAFHMNEALNGIAVAAWRNQPNHNAYNTLINSKLDAFRDLYPNATPQECYNFLTDLINDIRTWVINNPNSHLNDLVLP